VNISQRTHTVDDLDEGMRVELSLATDAWVTGDIHGKIVRIRKRTVHVLMDRSGRVRKLDAQYIGKILGSR
jgi:hypothetical protein